MGTYHTVMAQNVFMCVWNFKCFVLIVVSEFVVIEFTCFHSYHRLCTRVENGMCIHVPLRKMTTPYLHLSCIFNSYSLCLIVTKIKKKHYNLFWNVIYIGNKFILFSTVIWCSKKRNSKERGWLGKVTGKLQNCLIL